MMATPDPDRLGGWHWVNRTKGRLRRGEQVRLSGHVALGQLQRALALVRRPAGADVDIATPEQPDSALASRAHEALMDVSPAIVGHSIRTWLYGSALAALDRCQADPELLYVASLLHDVGLMRAVTGEDFTIRSGRAALACGTPEGEDARLEEIADAIAIHAQPGITVEADGATGFYVQAGALLDLVGLRARELPRSFRDSVLAQHDRSGLKQDIVPRIRSEARAVPHGRFALLRRWGFTQAITS